MPRVRYIYTAGHWISFLLAVWNNLFSKLVHDIHKELSVRETFVCCCKPWRRVLHSADHDYITETEELWTNRKKRLMQVRRVCVSEESYERELKLEMSSEVYDCIVVGAGIQGSCTAYQLAKNKQRTLLLEQVGAVFINN